MKDYYEILRIHPKVSDEEIKESYRRLAHKYHPDMENGDAAQFKEIAEAYEVLSDPYTRGVYDAQIAMTKTTYQPSRSPQQSPQVIVRKKSGFNAGHIFLIIILVGLFIWIMSQM